MGNRNMLEVVNKVDSHIMMNYFTVEKNGYRFFV